MPLLQDILNFFGKSERKEPVINKAISFGGVFVQNEASLGKFYELYKKNQFVRSAVVNLMDTIGKAGFELKDEQGDELVGSINEDIEALFTGDKSGSFQEFKKRMVRDYFIGGNLYIYRVTTLDADGNRTDDVTGLQVLDPRFMTPIVNKTGIILGYSQNVNGEVEIFLPEEIWHLKFDADIDDETIGMPLLHSLNIDLDLDEEAKESNLAYFKNNQTPASLIILEDSVSREDLLEMKKALQDQFKGGSNHHKGGVMKGLKDVIKVQDKISDAEFLNMRKFTLENVCALFGVPKTILGYTEGVNYSNADKQFLEYIEHTIKPAENLLSSFLTGILNDIGFEGVVLSFIDDHVDQKQIKSTTLIDLSNNGIITLNEAREELNLEPIESEDADKLWIGTNKRLVESETIEQSENNT